MTEVWYVLYGGSSEDGMGPGKYEGRTTDKKKAIAHFKQVKSSPYNTGKVVIYTDTKELLVWRLEDFS